jgi:AcrR family transcriptional regulator
MSKTQRQLQGEQTRQRIIEAAAQLFVRKGFYGTSIADLAQAVGLTKGALYHHFENKDAIFFAVIETVRDAWRETVARDVLKAGDALTRLAVLFDNHARCISENETLCLVMGSLVAEMDGVNPTFMAALEKIYADLTLFIERIIRKGQAVGQVRPDLDARLAALNIVGMLSTGCSHILNRMSADYTARMATLKQMLLDSLQP